MEILEVVEGRLSEVEYAGMTSFEGMVNGIEQNNISIWHGDSLKQG